MTILVDVMPTRLAGGVHVAVCAIGFLCLGYTAWISLHENMRQFDRGIMTLAMNPIPVWWVSSFMTYGLALAAFHMLRQMPPGSRPDAGTSTKGDA